MSKQDNSGPQGISLRDWFAGMAVGGIVGWSQSQLKQVGNLDNQGVENTIAELAYEIADAMLETRQK